MTRLIPFGLLFAMLALPNQVSFGGADLAQLEEAAMQSAVARVAPAVVRIRTVGGVANVGRVSIGEGPCSGLIVSPDGYLVSSSFNFVRQPSTILVPAEWEKPPCETGCPRPQPIASAVKNRTKGR